MDANLITRMGSAASLVAPTAASTYSLSSRNVVRTAAPAKLAAAAAPPAVPAVAVAAPPPSAPPAAAVRPVYDMDSILLEYGSLPVAARRMEYKILLVVPKGLVAACGLVAGNALAAVLINGMRSVEFSLCDVVLMPDLPTGSLSIQVGCRMCTEWIKARLYYQGCQVDDDGRLLIVLGDLKIGMPLAKCLERPTHQPLSLDAYVATAQTARRTAADLPDLFPSAAQRHLAAAFAASQVRAGTKRAPSPERADDVKEAVGAGPGRSQNSRAWELKGRGPSKTIRVAAPVPATKAALRAGLARCAESALGVVAALDEEDALPVSRWC